MHLAPLDFDLSWEVVMPEKETIRRARADKRAGKSPSTQAGEFVREEIEHVRQGKHGARSTKQAIAIGLSKARRAGVKLRPPKKGTSSARTRRQASRDLAKAKSGTKRSASRRRSKAVRRALKREGHKAASRRSLSRQAHTSARRRSAAQRSAAARRGAHTKGRRERSAAAKKAARTRARRG
ncbi:MAG TPA: DUF6496 domain-containing protein [Gemmatimonadaceae bacterium]|nr:DUF6496 domain-containing protein [Gemmatimonadaceae bacterium]